jgi:DKNYY family
MCIFRNIFILVFVCFILIACKGQIQNKQGKVVNVNPIQTTSKIKHGVYSDDTSKICKCPAQYELKDSSELIHIKEQFYKNKDGHLYEITSAFIESGNPNNSPQFRDYFNGYFSQEVDALTFEPLEGWYAKDKNYVYYYRPLSGGTQISKIDKADTKTFKLLTGHYKYAMDKNFYYDETQFIKGFVPNITKQKLDNKKRIIEMTCNNKNYRFEIME